MPVFVDIDKPQATVFAGGIDQRGTSRQRERQLGPALLCGRPSEDGLLLVVGDDQLATAVLVQVAQPDAPIAALFTRDNRPAVDFQPAEQ